MKVAWVGYIDSDNDKWYCNELINLGFIPKDRINDYIDLIDNRDFLRESEHYDVVVLCYIFRVQSKDDQRKSTEKIIRSKWRVSDLSTPENWKDRLLKTKARMARDVDYRDTDGCYLARSCNNIVCFGKKCHDYGETKQHREWQRIQNKKQMEQAEKSGIYPWVGRD